MSSKRRGGMPRALTDEQAREVYRLYWSQWGAGSRYVTIAALASRFRVSREPVQRAINRRHPYDRINHDD